MTDSEKQAEFAFFMAEIADRGPYDIVPLVTLDHPPTGGKLAAGEPVRVSGLFLAEQIRHDLMVKTATFELIGKPWFVDKLAALNT